jgi:hypothetical protein
VYSFAGWGYKYFVFPDSIPAPTSIKDQATNLDIAMATAIDGYTSIINWIAYEPITLTNGFGVTGGYKIYRSKNILW